MFGGGVSAQNGAEDLCDVTSKIQFFVGQTCVGAPINIVMERASACVDINWVAFWRCCVYVDDNTNVKRRRRTKPLLRAGTISSLFAAE